ncbi:MAG: MarR family transcriptional regulator [Candidatus Altiarchaeota archaeon]
MKKTYTIIMVLSFIYGGFLLATYCFMTYSILWREEVFGIPVFEGGPNMPVITGEEELMVMGPHHRQVDPLKMLTSPFLMFILVGGLISIANGIAIRSLTHEKEVEQLKERLKKLYLTPEEKDILDEIEKSEGEITQKELTERTGYSRVKTHRIIERLESKKVIKKVPYGQTNKIIMEMDKRKNK